MLSTLKRMKQWKTPKLLCISSGLCSYHNFDHGGTDSSLKKLHISVSHSLNPTYTTSTPMQVLFISPLYSTLSTLTFKSRSLVTQASSKDEEAAYQVLNKILLESEKTPISIKELCVDHIIKLCRNRNLRAAAEVLRLLRDKHAINSLPAYNHLLAAACENNDIEIVSRVFKYMLVYQLSMNSTTYFNVAKAVSQTYDSTSVLAFVKEISELVDTGSVTVINRIIYAFAECGHVDNAVLIFDHMKGLNSKPDLITFNTMLGILGKTGRVGEMLNVFASMKKASIALDIVSYNTVLNSLRKVGKFDLCVVLSEEMGKVGLKPDLRTYTALIEGFGRLGNIEESLRLFEEMKQWHICPSVYVYRSLISNLKRLGKLELALKFTVEMNECQEDLVGPKDFKKKNR